MAKNVRAQVWRDETPPLERAESEALCARLLTELGRHWPALLDGAGTAAHPGGGHDGGDGTAGMGCGAVASG